MAYKFSKGERELGDIEFEDDPGTGINFEDDEVSLETGGAQRLLVNNYGATITGSLEITGSAQSLIILHTRDADNLKEIAFFKDGTAAAAMQINSAEHFFLENEAAKDIILRLWERRISNVELDARDSKTRLQEWAQARQLEPPVYTLINRSGPDHSPIFKIQVKLQTGEKTFAEAGNKRDAEQAAARMLMETLKDKE